MAASYRRSGCYDARITLTDLGEFGAIDLFRELVAAHNGADSAKPIVGIGDDAAVWAPQGGQLALETTDLLIEEVHFSLRWFSWYDVGWKAMAVNLSDIAAMGGRPRLAFVTAGLRGTMSASDARSLYEGLVDCASAYDTVIAGGDTVLSPATALVGVAIYGETRRAAEPRYLARSAAKPGDDVGVSGPLGLSAGALRVLQRGGRPAPEMAEAHLRPRPALAAGKALLDAGVASAMDVSDGLIADLGKLCAASGVGASIVAGAVPVPDVLVNAVGASAALELALNGGEDYVLLAAGPRAALESAGLTVIGDIVEGSGVSVAGSNGEMMEAIGLKGYDAFSA